jgi:hypothetical protein
MKWLQRQPASVGSDPRLCDFIQPALNHLMQEGDGDILPIPFEFGRLSSESPTVLQLQMSSLSDYKWTPPRSFTVVRYPLKARRITQFTPVDSILLEALIFANGVRIESSRRPLKEKTVFSNRFQGGNGPLLYTETLWNGFAQRGMELASSNEFALKLDIADFYNSIPHAYLKTCLLATGVSQNHLKCLMNALNVSSHGALVGIPVGPHFSHLLAELCLADLDNTLTKEHITFTRFNDDIHIFASTVAEIDRANSVASRYMLGILGLSVNRAKQDLTTGAAYLDEATARHTPRSAEERSLSTHREQNFPIYHSRPTNQDLSEGRRHFKTLDVAKVITPYLSSVSSDEDLAYVFRLLRSRGVPNGIGFVVDHLDRLFPVITEAISYIETVAQTQAQVTKKQLRELFAFYESPVIIGSPFLQMMILRVIGKVADLPNLNKFVEGMSYLTAGGRRELLTIACERQTLGGWVSVQRNSKGWMETWEQSALDRF